MSQSWNGRPPTAYHSETNFHVPGGTCKLAVPRSWMPWGGERAHVALAGYRAMEENWGSRSRELHQWLHVSLIGLA